MIASKLRAWYAHRQGLDGSLEGKSSAEVLRARRVGSLGGRSVAVSHSVFARRNHPRAGRRRRRQTRIYELPSARGCTYVLPASDFALGLAAGQQFRRRDEDRAQTGSDRKGNRQAVRRAWSALWRKARSIPMDCAKPPAKPSATSARRARRKDSPPRSRWRSESCRHPAISAAFPPTDASISSAINTRYGVRIHCAASNCRPSRFTPNSRADTSPGSDRRRLPTFKRSRDSA